jgi:hypothetical protein
MPFGRSTNVLILDDDGTMRPDDVPLLHGPQPPAGATHRSDIDALLASFG